MDALDFLSAIQGISQPDLPPGMKLATIDPAYDAFATYPTIPNPKVTFDGETTMTTKQYPVLAGYYPAASERVLMVPVGRTYLIVGAVRSNTTVTRPDAEYNASSNQTITSGGATIVAFGTANTTSSLVTRATAGAGHSFTLNRTGLWTVGASIRYLPAASGERTAWIEGPASQHWATETNAGSAGSPTTLNPSITKWMPSGTSIIVPVYQNSGGPVDLEASNSNGWGRVNFAYSGPID